MADPGFEAFVEEYFAPSLMSAGFRRSGKRRFVLAGQNTIYFDVTARGGGDGVGFQAEWFVATPVLAEFRRSLGEKRASVMWSVLCDYLINPAEFGVRTNSFSFSDNPRWRLPSVRAGGEWVVSYLAELLPGLVPLTDSEALLASPWLADPSTMPNSNHWPRRVRAVSVRDVLSVHVDDWPLERVTQLLAQYPLIATDPSDVKLLQFLRERVAERARREEDEPPLSSAIEGAPSVAEADPLASVLTGRGKAELGSGGSVLVCRAVPGLAVLGEDADQLESVTRINGGWVMARYPGHDLAIDPYALLLSVAEQTSAPVLAGWVTEDQAIDVTGYSAAGKFWRVLLPALLDPEDVPELLGGMPSRARIPATDIPAVAAAVQTWAQAAGLQVDPAAVLAALNTPPDPDDGLAADHALDALLAAAGMREDLST